MFDDPKNLRLYEACEKVGLPVMFHIDVNKNMVDQQMSQVERVLETFPKCNLIAHAEWWNGLPDGTCDRMLQKYPNLYADTSGGKMLGLFNRERGYTREFFIRNADKILYGSDEGWWSLGDSEHPSVFFQLCDELDLPEDVKAKIVRGNAEKLFGLKGK
jgi:predicted TIM-barrel fold metal-dependent hydrolase